MTESWLRSQKSTGAPHFGDLILLNSTQFSGGHGRVDISF